LIGVAFRDRLRGVIRSYQTPAGKQAAWNLVALVVLTVLTQAAAVLTLLLLTNGLGPAGFGVFAFAIALQQYLYLTGTLGTALVLFREGVREPEQLDAITTAYQATGLAGSLVVGALTAAVAWFAPISPGERDLICLTAAGNVGACLALAPLFDVHHRQPLAGIIGLAVEIVALAAVFALVRAERLTLSWVGVVYAVKWWLITAGQYVVYRLAIRPLRLVFCGERLRRMIRSSLPLAGSTMIAGLPANAGVFFVRLFRGEADAGVFGVASQAAAAYLMFSYLAIRILQPHIAGPYGLDRSFLCKLLLFAALFLVLLAMGGFAVGAGVILWLLAPEYRAALVPMAVLLGAAVLLSAGVLASSYLVVLHRERTVLTAHAVSAVVYVAGVVVLVPLLGNVGAATAAALAAVCGTVWMVVVVGRNLAHVELPKRTGVG
jgi:O-antigen/teichoic acid export membrane protein